MVIVNPPVGATVSSVEIPLRREIRVPMRAGRRKLGFQPKCAQERSMGRDKVFPDGWMGFLEERVRKWLRMGEEPVRGGLEPEMAPDHLVVMVHGLVGRYVVLFLEFFFFDLVDWCFVVKLGGLMNSCSEI